MSDQKHFENTPVRPVMNVPLLDLEQRPDRVVFHVDNQAKKRISKFLAANSKKKKYGWIIAGVVLAICWILAGYMAFELGNELNEDTIFIPIAFVIAGIITAIAVLVGMRIGSAYITDTRSGERVFAVDGLLVFIYKFFDDPRIYPFSYHVAAIDMRHSIVRVSPDGQIIAFEGNVGFEWVRNMMLWWNPNFMNMEFHNAVFTTGNYFMNLLDYCSSQGMQITGIEAASPTVIETLNDFAPIELSGRPQTTISNYSSSNGHM